MIPIFARYVVDTLPDDATNVGVTLAALAARVRLVGGGGTEDTIGPATAVYVPVPSEFTPATEMYTVLLLSIAGLVVYADPDVTATPFPSVNPPLVIPILATYVVDTLPDDTGNVGVTVVVVAVNERLPGGGGTVDTNGVTFETRRLDAPAAFDPYAEM
jgi:hypothetical protein